VASSIAHRTGELRFVPLLGALFVALASAAARVADRSRDRSTGELRGCSLNNAIAGALELGLGAGEIAAAVKMAGYIQKRASEMTADKATHTLDELRGVAAG
jgi:hypothetical protein